MAKENKVLDMEFGSMRDIYLSSAGNLYFALAHEGAARAIYNEIAKHSGAIISYEEPDGSPGFGVNLAKLRASASQQSSVMFVNKILRRIDDRIKNPDASEAEVGEFISHLEQQQMSYA